MRQTDCCSQEVMMGEERIEGRKKERERERESFTDKSKVK